MRFTFVLLIPVLSAGCAMQPHMSQSAPPTSTPVAVVAARPTKFVETRYDVGAYREASAPEIGHEGHAVFRRTRVPASASDELETVPRTSYSTVSFAPLPASEELTAELATQKKITADLSAMQATLAELEQKMKGQYSTLVKQSAETIKVREQLEAERSRLRRVAPAEAAPVPAAAPAVVPTPNADVRW